VISNLLIDLDGTLTDPKSGIIDCVQYALQIMGQEAPKENDLF
jgi:phosphoglycolate phosphatase